MVTSVYKVLKTDNDFSRAANTQAPVAVFERRGDLAVCIVNYGGLVKEWSDDSVNIDDTYYRRDQFEFRIALA
ncbi:hypothetical protein [Paenibacillus sp. sgz500992]|uniref:hypothetical protein n=1 Tax=Paenibacillus sp. sgz500992 TaxID=3242476 RepID=UPI0036D2D980